VQKGISGIITTFIYRLYLQNLKATTMYNLNEINALHQQRHILIRELERKEITEEEYNSQMEKLQEQIQVLNTNTYSLLNDKLKKQDEETILRRTQKMAEEKVKKEKAPAERKARGPKRDSYASVILEVLQLKSVKTVDVAADKVLEKKPGRDKAKVKSQIAVMINEVKKGKKPAYTWDADSFQLNVK